MEDEIIVAWEGLIKGPRWAGLTDLLYDVADHYGLKIRILDRTGLFREFIRFEVIGPEYALLRFEAAMKEYNS